MKRAKRSRRPSTSSARTAAQSPGPFAQVHAWAKKIPRGRVATYGLLSSLMDGRLSAAAVGWAMRTAPPDCPWHRVVNARGGLSTEGAAPGEQRARLRAEGVRFDREGLIDLDAFLWRPRPGAMKKRLLDGL